VIFCSPVMGDDVGSFCNQIPLLPEVGLRIFTLLPKLTPARNRFGPPTLFQKVLVLTSPACQSRQACPFKGVSLRWSFLKFPVRQAFVSEGLVKGLVLRSFDGVGFIVCARRYPYLSRPRIPYPVNLFS